MSGSIDTNILLRFIVGDVPSQQALAEKLFAGNRELIVGDQAITEFVYVLEKAYTFPRSNIAISLTTILELNVLKIDQALFSTAIKLYVDRPALSFVDCCLATRATLDDNLPLWTFDTKLAKQSPTNTRLLA